MHQGHFTRLGYNWACKKCFSFKIHLLLELTVTNVVADDIFLLINLHMYHGIEKVCNYSGGQRSLIKDV